MKPDRLHHQIANRYFMITLLLVAIVATGCSPKQNPSFSLSVDEAKSALSRMQHDPQGPQRPVVILSGYLDPGIAHTSLHSELTRACGNDDSMFLGVSFLFTDNFDACRAQLIREVDNRWPSDTPGVTTEVDVVAVSMGGLIARYAALPQAFTDSPTEEAEQDSTLKRRLKIARLFTLSTPHRGADMAALPTLDRRSIAMRRGSDFIQRLNASYDEADYELYPYVRLDDAVVGEENTAPPGEQPWWLPNRPFDLAHAFVMRDPRMIAEVASHLRGSGGYSTLPRTPLPGNESAQLQTTKVENQNASRVAHHHDDAVKSHSKQ